MRFLYLSTLFLPIIVSGFQQDQVVMSEDRDILGTSEPLVPIKQSQPTLYDVLTIETSTSIFFSYAREIDISARFQEPDAALTLLVPTNHAVMALPKKPHQGGCTEDTDSDAEITEQEFEHRSKKKIERWISAHIIPKFPISFSSPGYPTLLPERYITFKQRDGNVNAPEWSRVILDKNVRIIGKREASNGVVYIIDGTITID